MRTPVGAGERVAVWDGLFGAAERAVVREQDRHVVVGVITQPRAHPGARVEAQRLPGTPQRLEAEHGLGVGRPAGGPAEAVGAVGSVTVDATLPRRDQSVADPGVDVREVQLVVCLAADRTVGNGNVRSLEGCGRDVSLEERLPGQSGDQISLGGVRRADR